MAPHVRLELHVKNAALYRLVTAGGHTVASFCRENGLSDSESRIGAFINIKRSPYLKDGSLTRTAQRLTTIAMMLAEDLFPPSMYEALNSGPLVREVGLDRYVQLRESHHPMIDAPQERQLDHKDLQIALANAMSTLTENERSVITMRFGISEESEECKLRDVGKALRLSTERISQIEAKALRKLRHRTRRRYLSPWIPTDAHTPLRG